MLSKSAFVIRQIYAPKIEREIFFWLGLMTKNLLKHAKIASWGLLHAQVYAYAGGHMAVPPHPLGITSIAPWKRTRPKSYATWKTTLPSKKSEANFWIAILSEGRIILQVA